MGMVAYWTQPLANVIDLHRAAIRSAMETGAVTFACYSMFHLLAALLLRNDPLDAVWQQSVKGLEFVRKAGYIDIADIIVSQQRFIATMQGRTATFSTFSDAQFDEALFETQLTEDRMPTMLWFYWVLKMKARFLSGDYAESLAAFERAKALLWAAAGQTPLLDYYSCAALTVAALYVDGSTDEQAGWRDLLRTHQEQLREWAEVYPPTFGDRYALVSAEIAALEGRDAEAMRLYEQSILSARGNGFAQNEGVALEVAARFYAARGLNTIANAYLRDARACFARWGADGKVRHMEQSYPHLEKATTFAPIATISAGTQDLDIHTIIETSQAISGEIVLSALLKTLIRIVLESAGARQGYLLLERDEELEMAAAARVDEAGIAVTVRGEQEFPEIPLPASILNFVRRSGDRVLLANATLPNAYSADEYFSRRRPRSVLCAPIKVQTRRIALLYLENDLATDVFTPDRLALLELLSSQAAISLENALVYEALRASEKRYRMSQEIGHVGNWEYDTETARFRASDEAKRIFGLDPGRSEFSIEEVEACIPERGRFHQALVDLIRENKPYNLDFEIHPGDSSSSRIIASVASAQRDEQGNAQRILGVIHDITERKRAEQEIRKLNQELERRVADRTARLKAANKELEAFAYSVSHDLRAPLRHIIGFLELLEKSAGGAIDAKSRHHMKNISDAAKKMGLLIEDLLAFSRMGRNAMSVRQVELEPLLRKVIREFEPDTAERNIDWHIGALPVVEGDASMLRIVFGNLISNALKFTQPRKMSQIEIGALPDQDSEIVIYVRDNGVGFDMAYADNLFGVFQRLHRADEFEGTGIGLANVRRIIARHGGRTWAKSVPDQGATFYFTLPHELKRDRDERP